MAAIFTKYLSLISLLVMIGTLNGCGLTQSISDGSVALANSMMYKQIKTLHLDFLARPAINNDEQGQPHTVVIRVYQLKERKQFDNASYASLFNGDSNVLTDDVLVQRDIRLRPDENTVLDMPLEPDVRYIAVAGMFISPNDNANTWRRVLKREELDAVSARQIEVSLQHLVLLPIKGA